MNVIIFGATGMVGRGILIECIDDPGVRRVLAIGRSSCGVTDPKLRELVRSNLFDYSDVTAELKGFDACFFSLGVSAAGLSESEYRRLTYDLTIAAADTLAKLNPGMTLCYVSGKGTDSTERGRFMWARVKGATENQLLRMPLSAYMFRPGFIQPLKGTRSRTSAYDLFYRVTGPVFPFLRRIFPRQITTTVNIGRAMINVARNGYSKRIIDPPDINQLAAAAQP